MVAMVMVVMVRVMMPVIIGFLLQQLLYHVIEISNDGFVFLNNLFDMLIFLFDFFL